MEVSKELFEIAKNDFTTAVQLYEGQNFNLAIFQLQQSVEKFVKSFGLEAKVIEEKDLQRKISHLPHKVFARVFKKKLDVIESLEKPILLQEMVPPHQRNIDRSDEINFLNKSYLKTVHLKLEDMEKIDSDEIDEFLAGITEIEKFEFDRKGTFVQIKDDVIRTQKHFKFYFQNVLKEGKDSAAIKLIDLILENPDEFAEQKLIEYEYKQKIRHNVCYLFYVWTNLSIITAPHEQSTRYPSSSTGRSPSDYNEKHLLVKYFSKFIPLLEKALRCMVNYLKITKFKLVYDI